ncbi:MAG: tRNA 2-thiouridine synthesizing protein E [Halopseudomonas sp.]|uniref:TusE/DsrC/DsvC family sulfur relay protein n=1 Tax=Halopseudomonas sp. TaxID=2901191 RepID=UPI0039E3CC5F
MSQSIQINLRDVPLDKEGFLVDLDDWSEALAAELALREGIEFSAAHLDIVLALRRFHQRYQLSPAMRPLVKFIGQELGVEKGNSLYLLSLFPGSPAKLASKIAGLPKPDNCL